MSAPQVPIPPSAPATRRGGRRTCCSASVRVLVPWTLWLAATLPERHVARNFDVAWSGFDVALAPDADRDRLGLLRGATWTQGAGAAAATLLVCDAWFDVLTSAPGAERMTAVAMAVFAELPGRRGVRDDRAVGELQARPARRLAGADAAAQAASVRRRRDRRSQRRQRRLTVRPASLSATGVDVTGVVSCASSSVLGSSRRALTIATRLRHTTSDRASCNDAAAGIASSAPRIAEQRGADQHAEDDGERRDVDVLAHDHGLEDVVLDLLVDDDQDDGRDPDADPLREADAARR